jgi:hypothetical protein
MVMKTMSNTQSLIRDLTIFVVAMLEVAAVVTMVSNFGYFHIATIVTYILTALGFYILYLTRKL